jgi:phage portal protein BeeE
MRGDSAARAAWYQQMQSAGVLSINEIRAYEGLNPIGPEGDERFMQMQMTTVKRIVEGSADG